MSIQQIDLVCAIFAELGKQGIKSAIPRQMNAVIIAANSIIEEFGMPAIMTTEDMGLTKWLASDDTGTSSVYMASVLGGFYRPYAHPADADDFGRCSRLLIAVPEFRGKIELMRDKSVQWDKLLNEWGYIEDRIRMEDWEAANQCVKECVD